MRNLKQFTSSTSTPIERRSNLEEPVDTALDKATRPNRAETYGESIDQSDELEVSEENESVKSFQPRNGLDYTAVDNPDNLSKTENRTIDQVNKPNLVLSGNLLTGHLENPGVELNISWQETGEKNKSNIGGDNKNPKEEKMSRCPNTKINIEIEKRRD